MHSVSRYGSFCRMKNVAEWQQTTRLLLSRSYLGTQPAQSKLRLWQQSRASTESPLTAPTRPVSPQHLISFVQNSAGSHIRTGGSHVPSDGWHISIRSSSGADCGVAWKLRASTLCDHAFAFVLWPYGWSALLAVLAVSMFLRQYLPYSFPRMTCTVCSWQWHVWL